MALHGTLRLSHLTSAVRGSQEHNGEGGAQRQHVGGRDKASTTTNCRSTAASWAGGWGGEDPRPLNFNLSWAEFDLEEELKM